MADIPDSVVDAILGKKMVRMEPASGRLVDEARRRRLSWRPRRHDDSRPTINAAFCIYSRSESSNINLVVLDKIQTKVSVVFRHLPGYN